MKGSECRLIEYMDGSKKRFIIPVYQRNYDWKTENCKQLYDDLVKVLSFFTVSSLPKQYVRKQICVILFSGKIMEVLL